MSAPHKLENHGVFEGRTLLDAPADVGEDFGGQTDYHPITEANGVDLKRDLGISAGIYDDRLTARITTAIERIGALGITLEDTEGDRDLVLMYAAWLWRCRVTQDPMGRMLQLALNNRLFGEKAREATP